jgi:hypothetical protein
MYGSWAGRKNCILTEVCPNYARTTGASVAEHPTTRLKHGFELKRTALFLDENYLYWCRGAELNIGVGF